MNQPANRPETTAPPLPSKPTPAVPPFITGGMTVVVTIGDVKLTIEGPVAKVVALLNWIFSGSEASAAIASLKLVFGAEK